MTPEAEQERTASLEKLRELSEKATPGPWGVGYWSGLCHQHKPGQHPGEPKCKFDYTLVHDEPGEMLLYDNPHLIVSLSEPSSVAGNYDYEEGGIVAVEDRDFIVEAVNYVRAVLAQRDREAGS